MTSEDANATAAASIKLVVTEVDWTPLTLFLPVISVIFNSAESISRFFASFEVEGCWSIAVVDPLCSIDKLDTTETFDPLVDWLALAEALTDSFGEVATILSTVWLFSACLSSSLPWAWFLSATTPAAKLLLVARAWLLLNVALAKLCPAPDETKLSATLTLTSSETELEAETEASATDALVSTLSCSREVVVLALSSLAGALLSDTFVAGSVLADLLVKTELLADTDWLIEVELLAETDWLSDWLTDWLVEILRETDSLVETESLTDWLTETEANSEACSAFAFRISACAWAMIEFVLASAASSLSLTSAETTALSVDSDISSA